MSDLFVESWGVGTPVVLVHGSLATGAEEWQAQRLLAEEGFRLLVLDRRGYGRSPAVYRAASRSEYEIPGGFDNIPNSAYEFAMLYGTQRAHQRRLRAARRPLRILISYGGHWFPWYMRRLAERPANIWFVVKNLFA